MAKPDGLVIGEKHIGVVKGLEECRFTLANDERAKKVQYAAYHVEAPGRNNFDPFASRPTH